MKTFTAITAFVCLLCAAALADGVSAATYGISFDQGRKAKAALAVAWRSAKAEAAFHRGFVTKRYTHRDLARDITRAEPELGKVGVIERVSDVRRAGRVFVVKRATTAKHLRLAYKRAGGSLWVLNASRKCTCPKIHRKDVAKGRFAPHRSGGVRAPEAA